MKQVPILLALVLSALVIALAGTGCTGSPSTAPAALDALQEGNERFAKEDMEHPRQDQERIDDTRRGQRPYATVIACSDSRVPVELLFDQGVGDLFVIRVAGNVCDTDEVGSIEYGVDHLGTPLLVVLGHEHCGAVTAVVNGAELHGSIPALVDNIGPALEKAKIRNPYVSHSELIAQTVRENVWQGIEELLNRSESTRSRVSSRRLKVVGAVYDIDTGKVEWLGEHPGQDAIIQAANQQGRTGTPSH